MGKHWPAWGLERAEGREEGKQYGGGQASLGGGREVERILGPVNPEPGQSDLYQFGFAGADLRSLVEVPWAYSL